MPRLTPPTPTTFAISALLVLLAIAAYYLHALSNILPINVFWLVIVAYLVLFLGNLIKGI